MPTTGRGPPAHGWRSPTPARRIVIADLFKRVGVCLMLGAEFGTGQVFLSMLWFFLFFIWIWLLITVFADIFRSRDLSGWGKAFWSLFVIVLPYLGVFVYLIARGRKMQERTMEAAQAQEEATRHYIQSVANSNGSGGAGTAADEIARLAQLRDKNLISEAEFQQAKAKALAA